MNTYSLGMKNLSIAGQKGFLLISQQKYDRAKNT